MSNLLPRGEDTSEASLFLQAAAARRVSTAQFDSSCQYCSGTRLSMKNNGRATLLKCSVFQDKKRNSNLTVWTSIMNVKDQETSFQNANMLEQSVTAENAVE